jgi:hypothetical protein
VFNTVTFILGLALGVLLLGDLARLLARLRWFYWLAPRLRPVDQTRLNVPPPEGLNQIISALSALGFSRLGEAGLPERARLSGPVQIWYFVDTERTTAAGTFVTDRPHAILYSWFGEEAVVVTAYPVGDRIEEPNYHYHTVNTNLAEAVRDHVAQIPDFNIRFGAPTVFESMATILQLDRVYNQKFSRLRGRFPLSRTIATSVFQLYLMAVLLGTVIVVERFQPPALDVVAAMAAFILLGSALYWIVRQRWG